MCACVHVCVWECNLGRTASCVYARACARVCVWLCVVVCVRATFGVDGKLCMCKPGEKCAVRVCNAWEHRLCARVSKGGRQGMHAIQA